MESFRYTTEHRQAQINKSSREMKSPTGRYTRKYADAKAEKPMRELATSPAVARESKHHYTSVNGSKKDRVRSVGYFKTSIFLLVTHEVGYQ